MKTLGPRGWKDAKTEGPGRVWTDRLCWGPDQSVSISVTDPFCPATFYTPSGSTNPASGLPISGVKEMWAPSILLSHYHLTVVDFIQTMRGVCAFHSLYIVRTCSMMLSRGLCPAKAQLSMWTFTGKKTRNTYKHTAVASDVDNYINLGKGFILHFRTYSFT